MDTAQWPQGIGVVKVPAAAAETTSKAVEKKPRPQKEQALNCPRCNSTNTKFCYYNNYSLSQPRYFCKTCRRYWTEGGSLRNVPVGGGSRKNKRSSSSSNNNSNSSISSNISSKKGVNIPDLITPPNFNSQNPNGKIHEGHDLNLAYNPHHYNGNLSEFVSLPFDHNTKSHHELNSTTHQNPNNLSTQNSSHLPVMEFLKSTAGNRGIMGSFMSINNDNPVSDSNPSAVFSSSSGFPNLHEFKPSLSFSLDGLENGFGNIHPQGVVQDHSRILFPFEELKPVSANDQFEQDHDHNRGQGDQSNGFWNGMLAGGSW